MGFNTTVIVLNDALDVIEKNPEQFVANLCAAIRKKSWKEGMIDVPCGYHCNPASVVETHHADSTAVILVGGNCGTVVTQTYGYRHHEPLEASRMLKEAQKELKEAQKELKEAQKELKTKIDEAEAKS